jgi:hypothetical protein
MEDEVIDVTKLTEEEFNFSVLRSLGDNNTNGYVPPKHINDTRDVAWWCDPKQPIPGYTESRHTPPVATDPLTSNPPVQNCQLPPVLPSSSFSIPRRRPFEFHVADKVTDCAVQNLRNTVAFLAVFAFARDTGEGLSLLSGSGRTVARSRTGAAFANERSKAERRLRKDFFEPLKRAGADNSRFLALLTVAKRFVVLGSLGTDDEVQDYLLAVSEVGEHKLLEHCEEAADKEPGIPLV